MKPFFDLDIGLEKTALKVKYDDKSVAYGFGNTDALNKWIEATNKNQIQKALGLSDATKYPLIWLVEGWQGQKVVSGIEFSNAVFHIAVNSKVDTLNSNRKPNFDILYQVSTDFLSELKLVGVKILPGYKFTKRSNFVVSKREGKESHTIDVWDTIILELDLLINTNCLKKLCSS